MLVVRWGCGRWLRGAAVEPKAIDRRAVPDSPIGLTSVPISVGTISPNSTAVADLAFDFSRLAQNSQFDLTASLIGDRFNASIAFANVEPYGFCNSSSAGSVGGQYCPATVTFAATTPLPTSWLLLGSALFLFALLQRTLHFRCPTIGRGKADVSAQSLAAGFL